MNRNTCEHGDHPAPEGERFCSEKCQRCESTDHIGDGCAGLCNAPRALLAPVIEPAPPFDPYTAMVREFHHKMGLVVRDTPSLGTPAEREERVRLMLEELLEVARALGVSVIARGPGWLDLSFMRIVSDAPAYLSDALHELADLQVTVSGTAAQFGLPLLAATLAVHSANMQKTPQGPGRKPLKPDGWKRADVSGLLPLPASTALRQLAGADPSQPRGCDRGECRPFAVEPCTCACICHEVTP